MKKYWEVVILIWSKEIEEEKSSLAIAVQRFDQMEQMQRPIVKIEAILQNTFYRIQKLFL